MMRFLRNLPVWFDEFRLSYDPLTDIHHWSFHFYMNDLNHNTQHHNTRR